MGKLVFVLIDGLRADVGMQCMSFLASLVAADEAGICVIRSELPPLSRPAYASLLTGQTPLGHGVLTNGNRTSCGDTFFHLARKLNLVTCAAAYHWFFELCEGRNFCGFLNRHWDDGQAAIQHGKFYSQDDYPDRELIFDAEYLRRRWNPDLMLVHAMGVDYAGHMRGGVSEQYRAAARNMDGLLAQAIPLWRDAGYSVLVASDHGMDEEGSHYDNLPVCTSTPLWYIGEHLTASSLPETFGGLHGLVEIILQRD